MIDNHRTSGVMLIKEHFREGTFMGTIRNTHEKRNNSNNLTITIQRRKWRRDQALKYDQWPDDLRKCLALFNGFLE